MLTNYELIAMYEAIEKPEEEKHKSLCRAYDIIKRDENPNVNVWETMADELQISVLEWRIYYAISIRVMRGELKMRGLS